MTTDSWQSILAQAQLHANAGENTRFLEQCALITSGYPNNRDALYAVSGLCLGYGFVSLAKEYLSKIAKEEPNDSAALMLLAQAEQELGNIDTSQELVQECLSRWPTDPALLVRAIYLAEYLSESTPGGSNHERKVLAMRWAALIDEQTQGPHPRPHAYQPRHQRLRIGYVSGDLCQHTVGLLLKEVLANHDTTKFEVFAYSSTHIHDWVTKYITQHCHFRDVAALSDASLAQLIRSDEIDILVDLSGHTARSRLSMFAYRPAPVQISWLGYYGTTGLSCIDAVLLDQWHDHEQITEQFTEPIVHLPNGRLCYYPAFPAPGPKGPPALKNGYITFGSFNNTLKYNEAVYALWAEILLAVPQSKLILKWRTLNDPIVQEQILKQFEERGVLRERIELRGPSFHMQMLDEYSDIDIALDPFPFSGGISSCEALYMGVPVITWPQNRVVSRQTSAFLSQIGRPELIAYSKEDYLAKACQLSQDLDQLTQYRDSLRMEMINSPLIQAKSFTKFLEISLSQIYKNAK